MPTHADKHRSPTTEFAWWVASPTLGAAVWAGQRLAQLARHGWRWAVQTWGDLTRAPLPGEPSRAERWAMAILTLLALAWAVLAVVL